MTFETRATQAGEVIRQAVEVGEMSKTRAPEIQRFERYRDQKARNQRVAAVIIGIAVPIALVLGIVGLLRSAADRKPAGAPTQTIGGYVIERTEVVASALMTVTHGAAIDLDRGSDHRGSDQRSNLGCDIVFMPVSATRGIFTNVSQSRCGGSSPIFLGNDPWGSLTAVRLASLDYSNPIIGEGRDLARELHPGDIYAIFTNSGDYTKLEILRFGRTVKIRYVTYGITRGLPSPSPTG